jgi:rhamnose transport system permease protein
VYRGLTFVVSRGKQVDAYQLPVGLAEWSISGPLRQGVVPWVVVVALIVAALTAVLFRFTRAGTAHLRRRRQPGCGAPARDCRRPRHVRRYVLSGAMAGLAGILYASRLGAVNPEAIGSGMELMAIAAVVVGGVSIFGGVGTVSGVGARLPAAGDDRNVARGARRGRRVAEGRVRRGDLLAVVADGIATRRWGGGSEN